MATRATSVQITMPQMGESVTEGTVLGWLKAVGDRVEADEPLVEVSTDKVDAEIPAPTAGTLVKILAEADETVQVGSVLGEIEPDDGSGSAPAAPDEPDGELVEVTFPEMGDSVAEGTILEWRVKAGDSVAVDDPLVEISTDKVDAEVPSPVRSPRSWWRPTRRCRSARSCAASRAARAEGTAPSSRGPRPPR
jgi:2-oxoglutarate dehydrogenase E1 component